MTKFGVWGPWAGVALAVSVMVTLLDPADGALLGWPAYLALAGLGSGGLALAWRHVSGGWGLQAMGRGLMAAVLVALLLRLGIGAFLFHALPTLGYQERHHQAGFFFPDAYQREDDARQLVASDQSLTWDRLARLSSDQYGGLLGLTVLVYKALAPEDPRPLLMTVVSAFVAAVGVLYAWGFATKRFGPTAGAIAAWIFALYPEGILLAATSMREPYIATALAMVLFGLACLRQGEPAAGWSGLGIGILLTLLVSPPFALLTAGVAGLGWILVGAGRPGVRWAVLLLLIAGVVLGGAMAIQAWSALPNAPNEVHEVILWRMTESAAYQMERLRLGSGWVQEIFDRTPPWAHTPLVILYGAVQPLLPAALADNTSVPLLHATAVLRALGWLLLGTVLLYAAGAALLAKSVKGRGELLIYLFLLGFVVLLAAYLGGGDQWDNPRYRSTFLPLQAAVAGWAIVHARLVGGRWLGRVFWLVGVVNASLLLWYAGRYWGAPRLGLYPTLALTGAVLLLSLAAMGLMDWRRAKRASLTGPGQQV